MKYQKIHLDDSFVGTFITIVISAVGLNEIDLISKIFFLAASTISCLVTTIYTLKKIKNLKNEKINEEH
jgi:hypothetical protein